MLLGGHLRWDSLGVDYFLKHMDHIEELTVDVANDDDGLLDAEHLAAPARLSVQRLVLAELDD